MNIHLIAIGGSIMHNLALALLKNGHSVTGSDDIIYGISKEKLEKAGILPDFGWFPEKIHKDLDLVILGMHAKSDNPELLKAQDLGLKIESFPSFIGSQIQEKNRVVVAGSHGKTTTTSMIMHVFKKLGKKMDYLVGAQLENFDLMVQLSDAPITIIEGDEYLSSAIDSRPKFVHYHPNYTIITGVAWDHMNVFPTKKQYIDVFKSYIDKLDESCHLFYDAEDPILVELIKESKHKKVHPYTAFEESRVGLLWDNRSYPMKIFGKHNYKNLKAAMLVCEKLGIDHQTFLDASSDFSGAKYRLETIKETDNQVVFRDFAHAPSKVKATLAAIKNKYAGKKIGAIVELHTYSSLNKDFLPEYGGCMDHLDFAAVCFDPKAVAIKRLETLQTQDIKDGFANDELHVVTSKSSFDSMIQQLLKESYEVIIFLSSGNLFNLDFKEVFPT